jgi:ubiquitin carboxyl-terminal hydrolase 4/11/15
MVHFPIDGLDLGGRIGERKLAETLHLGKEEAKEFGVETSDEAMIYDLCGFSLLADGKCR